MSRWPDRTVQERLEVGLKRMSNGCLEWTGACTDTGYGEMNLRGTVVHTHRLAWVLAHGPIPEGLFVLHHCDNRPCCDAYDTEHHLFLGTQQDNMDDAWSKGRMHNGQSLKLRCAQGHDYTEENTYVDSHGWRQCKTCNRIRALARYHANRKTP